MPGEIAAAPLAIAVARVVQAALPDFGLVGWPKTSGSRGFHIYARIQPRWPFKFVRLAAQTVMGSAKHSGWPRASSSS